MRVLPIGAGLLAALSVALFGAAFSAPTLAAAPYCPNPAHAGPEKAPPQMTAAIARTFHIDEAAARDAAFVRCVGAKLMACAVGANLNCFKADTRRRLPGATAWCRHNPDVDNIPMVATGHATIYEWSCKGRRAVAGKLLVAVDSQGFVAENWKEVR